MAEDQDPAAYGMRGRWIHRTRRYALAFRITGAGPLRPATEADPCGAGRQRIRSEAADRNLETAEEDRNEEESVLWRCGSPAEGLLGETRTGRRSRICRVDGRHE